MNAPDFIGGMRVLRILGEGGFGSVYAVDVDGYERPLALKVMSAKHQTNESLILRFKREAEVIERLASKYVATVYTMGKLHDGRPYILMELLEGKTLGEAIDEGSLGSHRSARLGTQICKALVSAHNMGVLHRDLKPDNIFIIDEGPEESIKILDFGIATFIPGHTDQYGSLTHTNALIGTPYYMSPEQVRAAAVGPASDLYMLGVVMYEMLTGERPFEGDNLGALLGAIVHGTCEPLMSLAPNTPRGLCFVIERAMSIRAADRYKSAGAMAAALEAAMVGVPPEEPAQKRRRAFQAPLPVARTEHDFGGPRTLGASAPPVPAHTLVGNPMDNELIAPAPRPVTAGYEQEHSPKTELGFSRGVFSTPPDPAVVNPAETGMSRRPSLGQVMGDRDSIPTLPQSSRVPLFVLAVVVLGLGLLLGLALIPGDDSNDPLSRPQAPIAHPTEVEPVPTLEQPPPLELGMAPLVYPSQVDPEAPPLELGVAPPAADLIPPPVMSAMTRPQSAMTRPRAATPETTTPETTTPETTTPETTPSRHQVIEILDPFI